MIEKEKKVSMYKNQRLFYQKAIKDIKKTLQLYKAKKR